MKNINTYNNTAYPMTDAAYTVSKLYTNELLAEQFVDLCERVRQAIEFCKNN